MTLKDFIEYIRYYKIIIIIFCLTIVALILSIFLVHKYNINTNYIYVSCAVIVSGCIFLRHFVSYLLGIANIKSAIIREGQRQLDDPHNYVERLDITYFIDLQVSNTLIDFIEEEYAKIATGVRLALTYDIGFILPVIHICDNSSLNDYEYQILIRDNVVASGYVYPDKYMVLASEWDSRHDEIPENAIVGFDPIWQTQVYWIDEETADKNKKYINVVSSTDVIKNHLREIAIKYANDLITIVDVGRYIEQAKTINKDIIPTLEKLNKRLSIEDIRQVFANLITEEVSVRDICYIFERLADYARKSVEPDVLSERIREDLKVQISAKNADANNVLYAIKLSKEWEKTLKEHLERTALGYVLIMESEQIVEFVEAITEKLEVAQECIGRLPVILCAPKNRLPIYKMLKRHIPTVVVMSYLEIADTVKLETVATIGEE